MTNQPISLAPGSTLHLIGICGTGMGTLAGLLHGNGYHITGSDAGAYPPMSLELDRLHIKVMEGYKKENLAHNPDLVVVGNVCRKNHVEVLEAKRKGLPMASMPHVIKTLLLPQKHPVVITGTHGKTTTTALTGYLLSRCGQDPSVLVGGVTKDFGCGYRIGQGAPFVIEGDEYDSAFFHKEPKFLSYRPKSAVITSVEHDHIDIYPTAQAYRSAFDRLLKLETLELLAVCKDDTGALQIMKNSSYNGDVVLYGLSDDAIVADTSWQAQPKGGGDFTLIVDGINQGTWHTPLIGRHNLQNTLAALIMCHLGLGVPLAQLKEVLPDFGGVARRQQILGSPAGVTIIDDFAHHPTAVATTLNAIKDHYPGRRLIAAFEPRSATACRKLHQQAYVWAFDAADLAIIAPPGRILSPEETIDTRRLANEINARGTKARSATTIEDVYTNIVSTVVSGDVVALLSNGAFGGLHRRLLSHLGSRAGKPA